MSLPAQPPGDGSRPTPAEGPNRRTESTNEDDMFASRGKNCEAMPTDSIMTAGVPISPEGRGLRFPLPPRPVHPQGDSASLDSAQQVEFHTIGSSTNMPFQRASDEQADAQPAVTAHRRRQTARRSRPFVRLSNTRATNRHSDTTALDEFPSNDARITRRRLGVSYAGFRYRSRTMSATHADLLAEIHSEVIELTGASSEEEITQENDTANYRENFH